MATRKIPNADNTPESNKITIEFDNGDLQAINNIKGTWRFRDEPSLFRFVLAVLMKSKNKIVYVQDDMGNKIPFSPSEQLIETGEQPPNVNP